MYSESRGFYYQADLSSIRDAEDEVRKAKTDKYIYELEKQITSLEEAMKKETDAIDEQLKNLDEYGQKWSDIPNILNDSIEAQRAAEILGADWEKQILDMRLDTLEQFTNQYIDLQKKQKEAYLAARQAEANGAGSGSGNGSNGGNTYGSTDTSIQIASGEKGHSVKTTTKTVYMYNGKEYETPSLATIQQQADARAAKEKIQYSSIPDVAKNALMQKAYDDWIEEHPIRKDTKRIPAKYTGTNHASPGETLVGELGSEIILNKNGTATIVDEPTIVDMKGGEKVFNAKETERILKASKKGFSSLKDINPKKFAMLNSFASGTSSAMQNAIATQAVGIASGMRNGLMNMPLAGANGQTINNTFNVSLPNINDASKASDLMREFEHLFTKSTQYFNK